jgi:hypothetical protein
LLDISSCKKLAPDETRSDVNSLATSQGQAKQLVSSMLLNTVEPQDVRKFLNLFKRFSRGLIMKKLSILAMALFAASAFAVPVAPSTDVVITGNSTQAASLTNVNVSNTVSGRDNIGQQNLATNAGDITIGGNSTQGVSARGGSISNTVSGRDNVASQNLSSNVGTVTITGNSLQLTTTDNSNVSNRVSGRDNSGTQNIASNNSCTTCVGAHR